MALCTRVLSLMVVGVMFLCKINLLSIFFCTQYLVIIGRVHLDGVSTPLRDVTCD